jgi:Flp pilus assembly protein TadD
MSIIYGTLERLEAENPVVAASPGLAAVNGLKVESNGLPLRLMALALLVVIAGMSLMLWRQGSQMTALLDSISAVAVDPGPSAAVESPELSPTDAPDTPPAAPAAAAVAPAVKATTAATVETAGTAGTAAAAVAAPSESTRPHDTAPAAPEGVAAAPVPSDGPVPGDGARAEAVRAHEPAMAAAAEPLPARDARAAAAVGEESVTVESVAEPVSPAVKESGSEPSATVEKPRLAPAAREQGRQADFREPAGTAGVEEAIEQARVSLSRGRYQHALSTLELIESVPGNRPDFWLVKGSAHLGIGQLDQAEASFDAAQALAPYNAQIAVQRAILKQERGDHAGALQILDVFADRNPNVPEIFLNQGYSQQALGSTRAAKRSFRTFLIITEGRSLYQPQRRVVEAWLAQVSAAAE